jgi:Glycosyl transferase family 11
MIGTSLYKGQGFGNQLWVYTSTRCAAMRGNYEFAILNKSKFKGKDFLDLNFGVDISIKRPKPSLEIPEGFNSIYKEKYIFSKEFKCDISDFDNNIFLPSDGTFLEGSMQSENYILEFKNNIVEWLEVVGPEFDGCVINIRGGEYKNNSDLFLVKSYYEQAIMRIRDFDNKCKFLIVTDDFKLARKFFSDIPIISSGGVRIFLKYLYISPSSKLIGQDFGWLQNAKYLILSNSSFSWWGAWTNTKAQLVIAPKYWARHNVSTGYWSQGDSLTRHWQWLDRMGNLSSYEECKLELKNFMTS